MTCIVSSNPHAFLRPIYRRLCVDRQFHLLAEPLQYDRLVEAAAEVSEHHATLMREYSPDAKRSLLRHLANAESLRPGEKQIDMWRLHKDDRVVTCVAVYLPIGIDLRVFLNDDLRRTQLVKDGPRAEALAAHWKLQALEHGWRAAPSTPIAT